MVSKYFLFDTKTCLCYIELILETYVQYSISGFRSYTLVTRKGVDTSYGKNKIVIQ